MLIFIIRTSDSCSKWVYLVDGVPQGVVLSPLIFSIFIDTVVRNLNCDYHMYAEVLQIYTHADPSIVCTGINFSNEYLRLIGQWASYMDFLVNITKSQAIVIGSQRLLSSISITDLPQLSLNGIVIPFP